MAKNLEKGTDLYSYYGIDGFDYDIVENEHMGLFAVFYGTDSYNGTSEACGQIPSIMYYLD